jgi:hypothetical protein
MRQNSKTTRSLLTKLSLGAIATIIAMTSNIASAQLKL